MEEKTGSLACPMTVEVPIRGGQHTLVISPWSMELHDLCFPIVTKLIEFWIESQNQGSTPMSLGKMITVYKVDVTRICQLTVKDQLDELGLTWAKSLYGEDLFGIADAIWRTSIVRPDGGGVMGKAMGLLGPLILAQVQKTKTLGSESDNASPPSQSTPNTSPTSRPPGSPSLPGDGEAPRASSVVN